MKSLQWFYQKRNRKQAPQCVNSHKRRSKVLYTVLKRTYFLLKYFHSKSVIQVLNSPLFPLSVFQPSEIPSICYKNAALPVKLCNCRRTTTINEHDNDQDDDNTEDVVFDVPMRIHLSPSIKHKHFQQLYELSDSHNSVAYSHVFWDLASSPPTV